MAIAAALVNRNYAINFMFTARQLASVGSVELQLPKGVQFRSNNPLVNRSHFLRLAIHALHKKTTLPFVIRALRNEQAVLKLKMFDRSGREVGDREMAVNFVSNNKSNSAL